jgi:hypothetical protein
LPAALKTPAAHSVLAADGDYLVINIRWRERGLSVGWLDAAFQSGEQRMAGPIPPQGETNAHFPTTPEEAASYNAQSGFNQKEATKAQLAAQVKMLEAAVQFLNDNYESVNKKLAARWDAPKFALGVIAVVVTIVVGINGWSQYMTISQLDKRADEMRDAINEAHVQKIAISNEINGLRRNGDELREKFRILSDHADSKISAVSGVADAAQKSLSFLALSQLDHDDPQLTIYYASLGEKRLEEALPSLKGDSALHTALSHLKLPLAIIQCRANWLAGNVAIVRDTASAIVARDAAAAEGHRYLGSSLLYEATELRREDPNRSPKLSAAIESLQRAVNAEPVSNPALILLAAAQFDDHRFESAFDSANRYLSYSPSTEEEIRRLGGGQAARVKLAQLWRSMSALLIGREAQRPNLCGLYPAIPLADGRIYLRVFKNAFYEAAPLARTTDHQNAIKDLSNFGAAFLQPVVSATCGPPVMMWPVPDSSVSPPTGAAPSKVIPQLIPRPAK